jgi:hypothetical protein
MFGATFLKGCMFGATFLKGCMINVQLCKIKYSPIVLMYSITNYTYKQAKNIGVVVKPSTNKTKKIDVYKKGKKIASVGANGMNDFPTYIKKQGIKYAKTRRRLYKMRHQKDRHVKWSRGWLADKLLW